LLILAAPIEYFWRICFDDSVRPDDAARFKALDVAFLSKSPDICEYSDCIRFMAVLIEVLFISIIFFGKVINFSYEFYVNPVFLGLRMLVC
jgi:hypothetical protein